jgi:hypothetical protein
MELKPDRLGIGAAIARVAKRLNIPTADAWEAIIEQIAANTLHAEGIDRRDETVAILPYWIRWLAPAGVPPTMEPDYRGNLWFEIERPIEEWHARRDDLLRRGAEPGAWPLPPNLLRHVTVSEAEIDALWLPPRLPDDTTEALERPGMVGPAEKVGRRSSREKPFWPEAKSEAMAWLERERVSAFRRRRAGEARKARS